jgi:hypothetical protein
LTSKTSGSRLLMMVWVSCFPNGNWLAFSIERTLNAVGSPVASMRTFHQSRRIQSRGVDPASH